MSDRRDLYVSGDNTLGSTITFDAAEGSVEEIAAVIGENKSSAIFFDSDVAFCMRMFRDRWGYLAFRRGG